MGIEIGILGFDRMCDVNLFYLDHQQMAVFSLYLQM